MFNWLRRWFLREEEFESHINILTIKWDKIPNPTSETRGVGQIPTLAHRITARNKVGALLIKLLWCRRGKAMVSLTENGYVLTVYPFPKVVK